MTSQALKQKLSTLIGVMLVLPRATLQYHTNQHPDHDLSRSVVMHKLLVDNLKYGPHIMMKFLLKYTSKIDLISVLEITILFHIYRER